MTEREIQATATPALPTMTTVDELVRLGTLVKRVLVHQKKSAKTIARKRHKTGSTIQSWNFRGPSSICVSHVLQLLKPNEHCQYMRG